MLYIPLYKAIFFIRYLNKFSKSTGIIVVGRFCITKSLKICLTRYIKVMQAYQKTTIFLVICQNDLE